MASSSDIYLNGRVYFQLRGKRTEGVVVAHEQAGKHRGKWIVRNLSSGRNVHRTTRQLTVVC